MEDKKFEFDFTYEIKLDSDTASYKPVDLVSAHFEINAALPLEFKAINVTYRGDSYVYGNKREKYTVDDVAVDHVAHEQYLMFTECVRGVTQLEPGTHCVLLQCEIPITAPSTFYGKYGCVHYAIEVKVQFGDSSKDQYIMKIFQVVAPLDLNSIENIRHPILIELEKKYGYFEMFASQELKIGVCLPSGGYCAGQRIPVHVCVSNRTHVKVKRIIITLVRRQHYHSEALGNSTESDLVRVTTTPVQTHCSEVQTFANDLSLFPGFEKVEFTTHLNIPEIVSKLAPNLQNCRIIDVEFFIKVTAKLRFFKTKVLSSQAKIHIGSIPLTDWHDPITITEASPPLSNIPEASTPDVNTELPPECYLNPNCIYPSLSKGTDTDMPTMVGTPHKRGSHIAVAPSAPPME